jgi:CsoR family transcriptional regulator, copper-sensing transcriptional repressor
MAADRESSERVIGQEAARILNRLARVEGQVRGLRRMVEEGKECEQVLAQLAAVRSALDGVGTHLISHHMKECLEDEMGVDVDPVALERAFEVFYKYVQCMR